MPNDNLTALDVILKKQRAAFLREEAPSLASRQNDLNRLKKAVLSRRRELETAADADFGHRAARETIFLDIVPLVQGINHLRRNIKAWMRPERRRVAFHFFPSRARVLYQPLGVVGIVSPWNYPISLTLMPLATAIAAGNRAMIKPSERTPATTAVLSTMLGEIFQPQQVASITGNADVAAAFCTLPFDHLIFTGSTQVGQSVMEAASRHLVAVTLELGGKSPVILDRGCDLDRAARSIAFGKLANAGQTCIAPDYAFVHADDLAAFVAAYRQAVEKIYPAGASDPKYTSIINSDHYRRLLALVDDARAKGALVVEIGPRPDREVCEKTRKIAPTVLTAVTDDMTVMQQEIFGPLLPVLSYRQLAETIGYVNARPRPLALYFFGPNGPARRQVLNETVSGNATVNDTLLHYAQSDLPFGGVGASGMGAYHGIEGFRRLSHAKGVYEQRSRLDISRVIHTRFNWVPDLVIRYLLA